MNKNAPYYLSYELDPIRKNSYVDLDTTKIKTIFKDNGEKVEEEHPFDEAMIQVVNLNMDPVVLISSDGFGSFYYKSESSKPAVPMEPVDMAWGFINYKGRKGEFLQRRASKEIKNRAKHDVFHFDDISMGAYINEDGFNGNLSTGQPD